MIKENLAARLMQIGNFRSAGNLYKELCENSVSAEDKIYYENKRLNALEMAEQSDNLNIGEAFFPVVDQAENIGSVYKINIEESGKHSMNKSLINNFKYVEKLVVKFLDELLLNEIKTIHVFDWGLQSLSFSIEPASKEFDEQIVGESLQLAFALALVSYIIKQPIPNTFAFSGKLIDNTEISIGSVKGIAIKTEAIITDKPKIKSFLIPFSNTDIKKGIVVGTNTLKETVLKVFPNLVSCLKELQYKSLGNRKIHLKIINRIKTIDSECSYAYFHHTNLALDDSLKVYDFLSNISQLISDKSSNGIIISGLRITYAVPMLISLIANHIKNYVAIRYTQVNFENDVYPKLSGELKPDGCSIVVRTTQTNATRKVGDHILYYLPIEEKH